MSARRRAPESAVVVGAGMAGLAAAWSLAERGMRVTIVESSRRIGGLVESERVSGDVMLEHGADALLARKPGGMPVLVRLGLDRELISQGRAPRRAFVREGSRLLQMPGGLFAFERRALVTMLTTSLLSPAAKARLGLEPMIPRSRLDDESVASFFERRMGPEVLRRLVAPMVRGIYGARATDLGVRAVFPALAGYEDRYGSVGLALVLATRAAAGPGLVTPRAGMHEIARRIAAASNATIELESGVQHIDLSRARPRVVLEQRGALTPDVVVVATDAATAARLLEDTDPELGELLGGIPSTGVEVVSLVFPRGAVEHALDGTGFVTSGERGATLACTFASEKWEGRAPTGTVVLRSVLASTPEASEAELEQTARSELDVLGLRGEPTLVRIRRRPRALPVYGVGHGARIERALACAQSRGSLALAGNYLRGVGVPDAIESGLRTADALLGAEARADS